MMSNEKSALCHFCHGHVIGLLIDSSQFSFKDKLHKASLFKFHMEKVIELDPHCYDAHAYLGRYEYEVHQLNFFERKTAAMFGYAIEGNLDRALAYLQTAMKGDSALKQTIHLFLGKIYQKQKQYAKAKQCFHLCIQDPIEQSSENAIVNEAKILLKDRKIQSSSFDSLVFD